MAQELAIAARMHGRYIHLSAVQAVKTAFAHCAETCKACDAHHPASPQLSLNVLWHFEFYHSTASSIFDHILERAGSHYNAWRRFENDRISGRTKFEGLSTASFSVRVLQTKDARCFHYLRAMHMHVYIYDVLYLAPNGRLLTGAHALALAGTIDAARVHSSQVLIHASWAAAALDTIRWDPFDDTRCAPAHPTQGDGCTIR